MNNDIIKLAKELMVLQRSINKAPSELLIELAVEKGIKLSKKYKIESQVVEVSLYLAHTIFSPAWGSEIQENHPKLSADFVQSYLDKWGVSESDRIKVLNSIKAHHNDEECSSLEAEIVKNAECFKFVSIQGALIWLHELGLRGIGFEDSKQMVLKKMEQKAELLTLSDCIAEAELNIKEIKRIFS